MMAMTIGESQAVQRLLDWLTGSPAPGGGYVTDAQAREAAGFLADRSASVLMAGMRAAEVTERWDPTLLFSLIGDLCQQGKVFLEERDEARELLAAVVSCENPCPTPPFEACACTRAETLTKQWIAHPVVTVELPPLPGPAEAGEGR